MPSCMASRKFLAAAMDIKVCLSRCYFVHGVVNAIFVHIEMLDDPSIDAVYNPVLSYVLSLRSPQEIDCSDH